jgi:uncharacterized membrane protein
MKSLNRLEKNGLGLFIGWFVLGLITTVGQTTSSTVLNWASEHNYSSHSFAINFVLGCLKYGDAVLILLAALNTYWILARQWGASDALRWFLLVVVISGCIETMGTLTGFPFGSYKYTDHFGPRIWSVLPITIPLAWFVVLTNILLLVREIYPMLLAWQEALLVASLTAIFDLILEPFARIKGYWVWDDVFPPWKNYLSWWMISFVLIFLFVPAVIPSKDRDLRSFIILACMLLLFATTRLLHGI